MYCIISLNCLYIHQSFHLSRQLTVKPSNKTSLTEVLTMSSSLTRLKNQFSVLFIPGIFLMFHAAACTPEKNPMHNKNHWAGWLSYTVFYV